MDAQIIPADTDYRMFSYKYYGSLPGVDIAFLLDSSAYHTHNDSPERIRPGTVQVCCPTFLVTVSQPLGIRVLDNGSHHVLYMCNSPQG